MGRDSSLEHCLKHAAKDRETAGENQRQPSEPRHLLRDGIEESQRLPNDREEEHDPEDCPQQD